MLARRVEDMQQDHHWLVNLAARHHSTSNAPATTRSPALETPNARPRLARLATANIAGSTTAFRVVMTTDSNDRTVARARVETARLSSSARGGRSSALAKAI